MGPRGRKAVAQRVGHRRVADRPASPPLPTTCNSPFQLFSGSQTSNESRTRRRFEHSPDRAETRQFSIGRLRSPGGVKAPLLFTRASVSDVSASLRPFRASQFGAAVAGTATVMANPVAKVIGSRRFIMWLLRERLLYLC